MISAEDYSNTMRVYTAVTLKYIHDDECFKEDYQTIGKTTLADALATAAAIAQNDRLPVQLNDDRHPEPLAELDCSGRPVAVGTAADEERENDRLAHLDY